MRKAIYRIFPTMAVVFLVVSALYAGGTNSHFEVESTVPTGGARGVALDQVLTATFNQELDCSTVSTGTFTVTGGVPWPHAAIGGTVTCSGMVATFKPSSPLPAYWNFAATITTGVQDGGFKSLKDNYVWTFTTGAGLVAPTVTAVTPINLAKGVALNTTVTAAFDQAMNPASINTSTFLLTGPGDRRISGTVTYDTLNNIATFTPNAPLKPNSAYTATITASCRTEGYNKEVTSEGKVVVFPDCGCSTTICLTNTNGDGLVSPFVWTFRTGAAASTTPPTVIDTNPANPAIPCVPANQIISATFSEAMNALSVTGPPPPASPAPQFTLYDVTLSTPVSGGTVTYAAVGNTATFAPPSPLISAHTYTATILTGVTDLEGNHLASEYSWTFTVCAAISPGLTVLSTFPSGTGACVNGTINATFSEPLEPATINTGTFTVAPPTLLPILGTVSLDVTGTIATFTPLSHLAANTLYTATLAATITDIYGDTLGTADVWTFTTGSATACGPATALGAIAPFGAFGGYSGITNQGIYTAINGGDIGTTAASTLVTGFHDTTETYSYSLYDGCIYTETPLDIGVVNGAIYTAAPDPNATNPSTCPNEGTTATAATAASALADAWTEYLTLAAIPGGSDPTGGTENLGGLTLTAGTYKAALGAFSITGSNLILSGSATDVFVFQMASSLTVGVPSFPSDIGVTLIGVLPQNVYWQVGSAATINYGGEGTMVGTIIAYSTVTISSPANSTRPAVDNTVLDGRAISLTGSVTMVNTTINVP
jgi:hypothetical protein